MKLTTSSLTHSMSVKPLFIYGVLNDLLSSYTNILEFHFIVHAVLTITGQLGELPMSIFNVNMYASRWMFLLGATCSQDERRKGHKRNSWNTSPWERTVMREATVLRDRRWAWDPRGWNRNVFPSITERIWHKSLCKFKVCNMIIWYTFVLWNVTLEFKEIVGT